jgi:tRNA pseudouridine38-40 synthase
MRIKGIIAYNGVAFYGFQTQNNPSLRCVEDELEKALSVVFAQKVAIYASGRTDRGVHALNQVIHFDVDQLNLDLNRIKYSLNCLLPKDIHIKDLALVDENFHSRFSAKQKHYRYIINNKEHNPMLTGLVYDYFYPLDELKMQEGMNQFLGEHNFYNFCTNNEGDFHRVIYSFTYQRENDLIIFDIVGSGFRRYMVRMIIGTILECAKNKITIDEISHLLLDNVYDRVRYKVPGEGLYLVEVSYGDDLL